MIIQIEELKKNGKEEKSAVDEIIKQTIIDHKQIIYNEDCYDDKYRKEMEEHGIHEIKTMSVALDAIQKSVSMFETTNVMTEEEINARVSILAEDYVSSAMIEVNQLIDMIEREIIPVVMNVITREKQQMARIVAVGPGGVIDGKEIVMQVKEGDKILYSKYAGSEFKVDGKELTIIRQSDILAIVE